MSRNIKILLTLVFIALTAIISTIYFITSKINSESINSSVKDYVESSFTGVSALVGKVEFDLGTSLNINLDNILLSEKKNTKPLIELQEVRIRVPLLAILTGKGRVDIVIDDSKVNILNYGNITNWSRALNTYKKVKKERLPSFLTNNKINLRFKKLTLAYKHGDNHTLFEVQKFSMKDINLKRSTAYEINIKDILGADAGANLHLVGEFDLKKLLQERFFSTTGALSLSDIMLAGFDRKLPELKGSLKLDASKEFEAELSLAADGFLAIKSKIATQLDDINFNEFNLSIDAKQFTQLFFSQISSRFSFNKGELLVSGNLTFDWRKKFLTNLLNISLNKPFDYKDNLGITLAGSLIGSLTDNQVVVNLNGKGMEGELSADLKTKVTLLKHPFVIDPIEIYLKSIGAKISNSTIDKILKPRPIDKNIENTIESKTDTTLRFSVDAKKLELNTKTGQLNAEFVFKNKKIEIPKFLLVHNKGNLNLTLNPLKLDSSKLNMNLIDMDLAYVSFLLPQSMRRSTGLVSANLSGIFRSSEMVDDNLKLNFKSKNGIIEGFKLKEKISSIREYYSLEDKSSNQYRSLSGKAKISNKLFTLEDFRLKSIEETFEIRLAGAISDVEGESYLKGQLISKKKPLTKAKDLILPIALLGSGLPFELDWDFMKKKDSK